MLTDRDRLVYWEALKEREYQESLEENERPDDYECPELGTCGRKTCRGCRFNR